ncbi:MAG: rhomboid family intramembrane serine protease [Gemmatimonas sp.]|nr:rhomboid family intramembrane serine protease [Gemmatimonas sp.]
MAYSAGVSNPFGFVVTPWVKKLLIANAIAFLITLAFGGLVEYLVFSPTSVIPWVWTPITYMFVHVGFFHLFFNMLVLFFFGPPLEERWGSREFVKFYFIAGLGGALLSFLFPYPIAGASGAIYGVMVAFAYYWPDNPIYIWGIFPIKAKWLVVFIVGLDLFYALAGDSSGVARLAHLGGAFTAFGYLKSPWAPAAWGSVPTKPRRKRPRSWNVFSGLGKGTTEQNEIPQRPVVAAAKRAEAHRALDEVDQILDKINEGGISSLTEDERRRLEEASRNFRSN